MTTEDDLLIPAFLKRTPEIEAIAAKYYAAHPPTPVSFIDERTEAERVARREREKAESYARIAKMKAAKEAKSGKPAVEDTTGKVWDNGHWIDPDLISQVRALRIMRELPSDRHRKIFVANYGDKVVGGIEALLKAKRK